MTEIHYSDQMVIDYKKYQNAVRKRAFSEVLEIINRVRLEIDGEPEDEKMELTWNRACDLMEKYVLDLKGGEQV